MHRALGFRTWTMGFVLFTAAQLQARLPDHLDGIPDDTVLFITNPQAGDPGHFGLWQLSYTQLPPANFFSGDPTSGWYNGFVWNALVPYPNRTFVADINGDGVDDALIQGYAAGWTDLFVGLITPVSNGVGKLGGGTWQLVGVPSGLAYFVVDVNGDGLADPLVASDDNGNLHWTAKYTQPVPEGTNPWDGGITGNMGYGESLVTNADNSKHFNRPLVGDWNGDGHVDVAFRYASEWDTGPGGFLRGILSGIDGLKDNLGFEDLVGGSVDNSPRSNGRPANVATLVGDLNGDGKDDIVEVDDFDDNGSFLFVVGLTGACGDASGVCFNVSNSYTNPFGTPPADTTVNIPLLADLNGDGRDDLVVYREHAPYVGGDNNLYTTAQWLVAFTPEGGSVSDKVLDQVGEYSFPAEWAGQRPMVGQFRQCTLMPCCPEPFADADRDHDVDQDDFGILQNCFSGAGVPRSENCKCFDRDNHGEGDGDIDVDDVLEFAKCALGPKIPADPGCGL